MKVHNNNKHTLFRVKKGILFTENTYNGVRTHESRTMNLAPIVAKCRARRKAGGWMMRKIASLLQNHHYFGVTVWALSNFHGMGT
jgi:hypothetical protein